MTQDVDLHFGRQLRRRRLLMQKSQADLGAAVGKGSKQIQKYEVGEQSIKAKDLWTLSELLQVPVAYFFEGLKSLQAADALEELIIEDAELAEFISVFVRLPEDERAQLLATAKESANANLKLVQA